MKRLLLVFVLLCGSAFAQTTIYVDFGYTGGSNAGTQAHPYATMGSMWTGVNAALASSPPVTVYFSARQPGSSSAAVTTSPLDMTQCSAPACTNSSTLASNLVFDGIQNYNSGTATVPVWSTNVTPIPCTDLNTGTQVCGYNTAAKLVIQASVPITGPSGSTDFADCEYGFTVQGISFQASGGSAGQSANLTYLGNLLFQYNEVTRISLGSNGPGLYLGPGQHGPCHTGSARPAGTDSGPDNVTIQYNYIHSTWGECIYDGASTSDPFVNGAPSNSQQVEGGSVSGDNLGCGNGCSGNASCTTASSANASICNTGANHLIHGNTVESCAVWNGQGDGMDIKDGHANLVITNNNVYPGKTPTCSPTCSQTPGSDGRGILVESATLIDSNFVQAPQHDGIDLVDSWNTSTGRSAVRVSNNVVVNINGVGNTNCYELEPLNVTGLAQWGNVSFENNTAYSCTDDGISVAAAATGTVLATNGIYQSTAGHSYAIGTASFNNYSSSGSCPNSETGTICSSPLFVSTSAPYLPTNFALQGGSAALTAGTNLFSTFTNDFLGNTRQSSGAWEMGAFTPATTTSTPTLSLAAGSYANARTSTLATSTSAASIVYTADGSTPTVSGTNCTVTNGNLVPNNYVLPVSQSVTITAIGCLSGANASSTVSAAYTITYSTTLAATNFGMTCGFSNGSCKNPSPPPLIKWPTSTATPTVVRMLSSGTNWAEIETASGVYSWTKLDGYLDGLAANAIAGSPPLSADEVIIAVPCWNVTGTCPVTNNDGGNQAPNDLTATGSPTFNAFVTAFVNHCSVAGNCVASLIKYYEMWNEPNLSYSWAGTELQLEQMIAPAAQIIAANVPNAIIMTPSFSGSGACPGATCYTSWATTWLAYENTVGPFSSVVLMHEYIGTTTPESHGQFSAFATAVHGVAGWSNALLANDETNWAASNGFKCVGYSSADCIGQIVRWQILHDSNGFAGLWWFSWNGSIGNGPVGYATAYYQAQLYLTGGHFTGAASGSGSPPTWTAPFVEGNGKTALWVWTTSESGTTYTVPSGYTNYRDISGGSTPVVAGNSIAITVQPIMLEQSGSISPPATVNAAIALLAKN